jgi:hypothetical protein
MDSVNRNFILRQGPPEYVIHDVMSKHLALFVCKVALCVRGVISHRPTTMIFTENGVKTAHILVDFSLEHFLKTILQLDNSASCKASTLNKTVTNFFQYVSLS